MKQTQQEKHFLNLAGEFSVCAELFKRRIHAHMTFGNHKATDILIVDKNKRVLTIEVKTSMSNKFVTGFFNKFPTEETPHPDFWVLVHINEDTLDVDYYILKHSEMAKVQMQRNKMETWAKSNGVDNVLVKHLGEYKNRWEIITIEL